MSFSIKTGRRRKADAERLAWMRRMQGQAQSGAVNAAQRIGPASQRARELAGDRFLVARQWSAPQLDRAADFVEHELGPRVGAMLSSSARRVEPEPPRRGRRVRTVALTVLGVLGVVGIAGALMTRARLDRAYIEDSMEEANTELHSQPQPPQQAEPSESRS